MTSDAIDSRPCPPSTSVRDSVGTHDVVAREPIVIRLVARAWLVVCMLPALVLIGFAARR